jgi:hypothetical protein
LNTASSPKILYIEVSTYSYVVQSGLWVFSLIYRSTTALPSNVGF